MSLPPLAYLPVLHTSGVLLYRSDVIHQPITTSHLSSRQAETGNIFLPNSVVPPSAQLACSHFGRINVIKSTKGVMIQLCRVFSSVLRC